MGGKASFLLVLGFSLIFLVFTRNFGTLSLSALDNYIDYYNRAKAHHLAISGANMAANSLFIDQYWDDGYNDLAMDGGLINVYVLNPLAGMDGKVKICHIPPGNPANRHTIWVSQNAVNAHLAHGDYLGDCDNDPGGPPTIEITAEGVFNNQSATVTIKFQPSKFSRFAYFSLVEPSNIWWTNQDTVWGPFHTNSTLRVAGNPVYYGKVTINGNIKYYTNKNVDKPKFYGGFESGVNLPLPANGVSDLETAANAGGKLFSGKDKVYLYFSEDSVRYKYHPDSSYSRALLSSFAPNGIIFAQNAELHLQGTVKGQYTVGCSGTNQNKGIVYLDDNIVYNTNPKINPNATDMLGIVAKRHVYITDNTANNNDGIDIQASIYCETGGFGAQNYDTRPFAGAIRLLGGIIQNTRNAVSTFSGSTINHGFSKRYRYDDRLLLVSPPSFPGTGGYEIVSWQE